MDGCNLSKKSPLVSYRYVFQSKLQLFLLAFFLLNMGKSYTQVIISQYYEGTSNNKWIEISNMGTSSVNLASPQLYLCSVTSTAAVNPASAGSFSTVMLTGTLASGASALYKNTSAVAPAYATGTTAGSVNFNGTFDVVFLSTANTPQATCWGSRTDMFGPLTAGSTNATSITDISYVRNAAITTGNVGTITGHVPAEWTSFALAAVDGASNTQTEYLGVHNPGCTSTKLAFTSVPVTNINQDATFSVSVAVQNALNITQTCCTSGTVTLSFSGCGLYQGSTLATNGKTLTATVVNGVATFSTLSVKRSTQSSVNFTASYSGSCGTLSNATSTNFNVINPVGTFTNVDIKNENFSGSSPAWAYTIGTPTYTGAGGGLDVTGIKNYTGNNVLSKSYSTDNASAAKKSTTTVTFDVVTGLSTYNNLAFSFKIASLDKPGGAGGSGVGVDGGDNLLIDVNVDGSGWQTILLEKGNADRIFPLSSTVNSLAFGTLTTLDKPDTKSAFTVALPAGISSFQFRMAATNNRTGENWVIDDVKLTAQTFSGSTMPQPLPTVSATDIIVCPSTNGQLSAAAQNANPTISYLWSVVSGSIVSGGTTQTPTVAVGSYNVVITDVDGCLGSSISPALVTAAAPSAPAVADAAVCGSSTATMSASGAMNTEIYKWYDAANAGTLLKTSSSSTDNTYTPTPTPSITTSYWVAIQSAAGCESARTQVNVNVATIPSTPTASNGAGCTNTSVTLGASGAGVTEDYYWYAVSSGGSPVGSTDTYNTPLISTSTDYYISQIDINTGCESARVTATATIHATPTATPPTDKFYCNAATTAAIALSGTPLGVTFDISGGTAIGLANQTGVTAIPSFTAATGTATISITPKANSCTGTAVTYNVTVNALPTQPSISSTPYCGSVTLAVSSTPVGTINWYNSSTSIPANLVGTGNTFSATTAGDYYVTDTDNSSNCSSTPLKNTISAIAPIAAIIPPTNSTLYDATGECLDGSTGWTNYYNDLIAGGPYLLLSLHKHGQNIGTVGDGTFHTMIDGISTGAVKIPQSASNYVQSSDWYVMNRYWKVTPNGLGLGGQITANVDVRFYFKSGDYAAVQSAVSTVAAVTDLYFYKINGSAYNPNPNPISNHSAIPLASDYNSNGYHQYANGITGNTNTWAVGNVGADYYAEFTVGQFSGGGGGASSQTGAFPLELLSFTGFNQGMENILNWHTASETNVQQYDIERVLANAAFEKIGSMPARNINNSVYLFKDQRPLMGHNYYRLKMIDINGEFSYSPMIDVLVQKDFSFNIYPNPASSTVNIQLSGADADVHFSLYNALGEIVTDSIFTSNQSHQISTSELAQGVYFYEVSYLGKKEQGKLMIQP
jgi:Ig-like domain CHU_C associated/Secretion system C-terminal sorting domain